jgi:hypothetical protein
MSVSEGNGMVFQAATIPFTEDAPRQQDSSPPLDDGFTPEYPGATPDAPYGYTTTGRVRKRAPNGSRSTGPTASRAVGSAKQAQEAAKVLTNFNRLLGFGFAGLGLFETAGVWNEAQDTFYTQAVAALENDPGLCRTILKTGATGGKLSLFLAYGMLGLTVAPVAVQEYQTKRAEAEAVSAARI